MRYLWPCTCAVAALLAASCGGAGASKSDSSPARKPSSTPRTAPYAKADVVRAFAANRVALRVMSDLATFPPNAANVNEVLRGLNEVGQGVPAFGEYEVVLAVRGQPGVSKVMLFLNDRLATAAMTSLAIAKLRRPDLISPRLRTARVSRSRNAIIVYSPTASTELQRRLRASFVLLTAS
jgi:hypothetical protein